MVKIPFFGAKDRAPVRPTDPLNDPKAWSLSPEKLEKEAEEYEGYAAQAKSSLRRNIVAAENEKTDSSKQFAAMFAAHNAACEMHANKSREYSYRILVARKGGVPTGPSQGFSQTGSQVSPNDEAKYLALKLDAERAYDEALKSRSDFEEKYEYAKVKDALIPGRQTRGETGAQIAGAIIRGGLWATGIYLVGANFLSGASYAATSVFHTPILSPEAGRIGTAAMFGVAASLYGWHHGHKRRFPNGVLPQKYIRREIVAFTAIAAVGFIAANNYAQQPAMTTKSSTQIAGDIFVGSSWMDTRLPQAKCLVDFAIPREGVTGDMPINKKNDYMSKENAKTLTLTGQESPNYVIALRPDGKTGWVAKTDISHCTAK